jgi:hypothetical protein
MRRGRRQSLAGVVINAGVNAPRSALERLEAILTNCVRHGPADQNRAQVPDFRAHLAGRVAHVADLSPYKGRRLWRLFDQIRW